MFTGLQIRITLMRTRIHLFTLMNIHIHLFTLMRIRDPQSDANRRSLVYNPSRRLLEPPRLYCEHSRERPSMAPFKANGTGI
jgi:hypothetical protein